MKTFARRALAAIVAFGMLGTVLVMTSTSANAARPLAKATLKNTAGVTVGQVSFIGPGTYADRVEIRIVASAAPNLGSFHGFHIHMTGVCDPNVSFSSAGGHWNPSGATHGGHKGDLPSVLMTVEGETFAKIETDRFNVTELVDAAGDGSAVVLHAGPDNFANIPAAYGTPNDTTLATGDAGGRYACGVVRATG